jgi:hypothetical protein
LYAVLAAHCAVFAVIVWIRTGLRWFALSGIAAALATTMPVVHPDHHDWTTTDSLVLVGGIVTMGLCVFIQSQVDSAGWAELRRSLREANVGFVGVLLFRHIPDFRARRS